MGPLHSMDLCTFKKEEAVPQARGAAAWRPVVMRFASVNATRGRFGEGRATRAIVMSNVSLRGLKKVYDGNVLAVYDVNL